MLDVNKIRDELKDTLKIQETPTDPDCVVKYDPILDMGCIELCNYAKQEILVRSEKYSAQFKEKPNFEEYYRTPDVSILTVKEIFQMFIGGAILTYSGINRIFEVMLEQDITLKHAIHEAGLQHVHNEQQQIQLVQYAINNAIDRAVLRYNEEIFYRESEFNQAPEYAGLKLHMTDMVTMFHDAPIYDGVMHITEKDLNYLPRMTDEKYDTILTWAHRHGVRLLEPGEEAHDGEYENTEFCNKFKIAILTTLALSGVRMPYYYNTFRRYVVLAEKLKEEERDVFQSLYIEGVREYKYMKDLKSKGINYDELIQSTIVDMSQLVKEDIKMYWKKTNALF